jgi:glutamyl-tRNA synthetase
MRTVILEHEVSLIDLILWATIRGNRVAQSSLTPFSNVVRWFTYVGYSLEQHPSVSRVLEEYNSLISKTKSSIDLATLEENNYDIDMP